MIVGDAELLPDQLEGVGGVGRDAVIFGEQLVVFGREEEIHVRKRQINVPGALVHGDAVRRRHVGVAAVLARGGENERVVDAAVVVVLQLRDGVVHGHGARHEGREAEVVRLAIAALLAGDVQKAPGGRVGAAVGKAAVLRLRGLVVVIALRGQIVHKLHGLPEKLADARLPAVDSLIDRRVVRGVGHHVADGGVQKPLAEIAGVALERNIAGRLEAGAGREKLRPVLRHRGADAGQQRLVDVQAAELRAQRDGVDLRRRARSAAHIGEILDQSVERAGEVQLVRLREQLQRVRIQVRVCLQVGRDEEIDAGIRGGQARLHRFVVVLDVFVYDLAAGILPCKRSGQRLDRGGLLPGTGDGQHGLLRGGGRLTGGLRAAARHPQNERDGGDESKRLFHTGNPSFSLCMGRQPALRRPGGRGDPAFSIYGPI